MTRASIPAETQAQLGIEWIGRFVGGLEAVEDLRADLVQALGRILSAGLE